jgi:HEAT repeat protein
VSEIRDQIERRLADSSPEVRRRAVAALEQLPLRESIELVLGALGDQDWRVRKEAVALLARVSPEQWAIRRLVEAAVQEERIGLRNAAAEALGGIGDPALIEIIDQLSDQGPGGRKILLEVVGGFRDPRATEALINGLADPDNNVRIGVAEWLGEHGGEGAREALIGQLGGDDHLLTLAALQSLNRLGVSISWDRLEPLAERQIYGAEILLALGRSGEPRAAQLIVRRLVDEPAVARALVLLHDASPAAELAVEQALAAIDRQQLDALSQLARDAEPVDRRAAVQCLIWSRLVECVPLLVSVAQEESFHPQVLLGLERWGGKALEALEDLLPQVQGRSLASVVGLLARLLSADAGRSKVALFSAYLNSTDIVVATAAAGAMARFGDRSAIPRLIELAGSESARVRRAAGHALVEVGQRETAAVRAALSALEIEDVRGIQICRVLEVVGQPDDAALLASALSSPNPELRRAVLGALAAVAGPAAVETISLAMTDEDVGVRMAAALALARIGPSSSETIVSALNTAEGPLRAALVRALGRVGHAEAPEILRAICRGPAEGATAALEAMENLGLDPGELEEEILAHEDAEVVKQALSSLGGAVAREQLVKLLAHQSWDVRLAAVERLAAEIDQPAVARVLEERLLVEQDDLVAGAIERALDRSRRRE